jgi:hypothetical protein
VHGARQDELRDGADGLGKQAKDKVHELLAGLGEQRTRWDMVPCALRRLGVSAGEVCRPVVLGGITLSFPVSN